ncbi:MAG: glyceraldehyde-3-phosphate dehydrogenase [Planktomarina sp.]
MTHRLALIVGGMIIAALLLDLILQGGDATHFLLRKLMDLIEWLAFWR